MQMKKNDMFPFLFLVVVVLLLPSARSSASSLNELSKRRAVLQTSFGDLHLAFYETAAPATARHIITLLGLGAYNSNHFFRVDKGFVAQVAGIEGNLMFEMNEEQREQARKTVLLEVHEELRHDRAGLLSLARHDDPNSGGSSFSIMLGPAPHLDMNYAIFGEVVEGLETLRSMEGVETTRDGIFVMPVERITIHSTYMYDIEHETTPDSPAANGAASGSTTAGSTTAGSTTAGSTCAAEVLEALLQVRQELVD